MKITIEIPLEEYQRMKEEINLLKDKDFLKKLDRLLDILYREKQQLYLGDFTDDLTEAAMENVWDVNEEKSVWDEV